MSTRWFLSHVRQGLAAEGPAAQTIQPQVVFKRSTAAGAITAVGPTLRLAGPSDVAAIDRSLIIREEPPPGTPAAAENIMAAVEFAYADLPWLLSTKQEPVPGSADRRVYPWLVLVVLSEDEAAPPRDENPAPILTAPLSALPPLNDSWAWAHVEARLELDDAVQDPAAAKQLVPDGVRQRSAAVVARLLCPRKLEPNKTYFAAVVPVPASGSWSAAAGATTVELTVFHWWSFHTGQSGTFEDLARRLHKVKATNLGVGARTIDVTAPWPPESSSNPGPPAASVTMAMDGALRVPGNPDSETWSNRAAQDAFRAKLVTVLNAPASRRDSTANPDRDTVAVGPPLYGSHHSGEQSVKPASGGWITTLNLEVRRRVAAALGTRYVQVEQEFLMARAWEQVGAIRKANRLLAAAELATAAANASRAKNINPLNAADLILTIAPMAARVGLPRAFLAPGAAASGDDDATLAQVLRVSDVPKGMPTTAYARLTRRSGAVARRFKRATGSPTMGASLIASKLPTPPAGMPSLVGGEAPTLVNQVRARTAPLGLQFRRMADVIASPDFLARSVGEARPLAPIMKHPRFNVPIAEEILARWPEWAIPGITGLPENSVMVVETNPEFVAALLVGLNHEFNRELLWREFPTDQRGTPFARFWPTAGNDVDEIARWPIESKLGSQVRGGAEGSIVLVIRGEVLRRFPAAPLVAVKGVGGKLPDDFTGIAATPLPLDESTMLYIFTGITETKARDEDWFFVLREPMRGTQFGFDLGPTEMKTWADLTWTDVTLINGFVRVAPPPARQPPANTGVARWGSESADMARIAFQQPFQIAFRAREWLS